ncbi:MAG: hypothetical protein HY297_00255 [Thaumarchaeota archaeon]|nr:hypothetical protein [Nitrososphaerota archaeon]
MAKQRKVLDYLEELEKGMADRPEQVKDGLQIYVGLWRKAMENGVVAGSDDVEEALQKIEGAGGLYKAAEDA